MNETLYYSISLFLIVPVGFLYSFSLRDTLRHPFFVSVLTTIAFYSLCFFTVPYLVDYSNGHNVLIMIPALGLFFAILHLNTTTSIVRSIVVFLWASGFISFASAITRCLAVAMNYDYLSTRTALIRVAICIAITLFAVILTSKWDARIVTDPNVPERLWLSFLALPAILFYQNTALIAYRPHPEDPTEMISYLLLLFGNLVLFILISNVFYSNATLYLETARVMDEKRILELQKSQYNTLTKTVDHTKKTIHDFKHTINTLKTMAKEDGATNILSYLETMNLAPLSDSIMNYCKHAPINSVLNYYCLRAKSEDVPINLQVDLPDELPMEDYEICSLIGNLMENAIDACLPLKKESRNFSFSIVMQDNNLIIVSSNAYNGKIKRSGEDFLSTKHAGHGIGLRSVRETVEHHGGVFRVHHDKENFFVDIMLSFD